jgi:hypothetical protein
MTAPGYPTTRLLSATPSVGSARRVRKYPGFVFTVLERSTLGTPQAVKTDMRKTDKHAWRPVAKGSLDATAPDGMRAVWRGRSGWYVYENDKLVSMGGIRNADGSYVYTDGFRLPCEAVQEQS